MKQAAVATMAASLPKMPRYRFPSGDLLTWLEELGRAGVMRSRPRKSRAKTGINEASST